MILSLSVLNCSLVLDPDELEFETSIGQLSVASDCAWQVRLAFNGNQDLCLAECDPLKLAVAAPDAVGDVVWHLIAPDWIAVAPSPKIAGGFVEFDLRVGTNACVPPQDEALATMLAEIVGDAPITTKPAAVSFTVNLTLRATSGDQTKLSTIPVAVTVTYPPEFLEDLDALKTCRPEVHSECF
ncbi:MAG: hypothetical protein ACI9WU_002116 [Myxococcota bacterium]|jgi:hypothetical protein